jgi:hypothetical protein
LRNAFKVVPTQTILTILSDALSNSCRVHWAYAMLGEGPFNRQPEDQRARR